MCPESVDKSDLGHSASEPSSTIRILADWNHDGALEELSASRRYSERFVIVLPVPHLPAAAPNLGGPGPDPSVIHPAEIGKVVVQIKPSLPAGAWLMLRVDEAAIGRVSLFQQCEGQWQDLGAEGAWKIKNVQLREEQRIDPTAIQ